MGIDLTKITEAEPLASLLSWAGEEAAAESIALEDLIARALEWERRRLNPAGPKPDYRTKIVGRIGMASRMKPGELNGGDVADLAGVPYPFVQRCARLDWITSKQPTARGVPAVYDRDDALVVAVASQLDAAARTGIEDALRRVRDDVVWSRPLFLIVGEGDARLVAAGGLAEQLARTDSSFVVNVGGLTRKIADRAARRENVPA